MTREPPPPAGEPARPQLQAAAATFDLLSAPTRLHLMWLLARSDYDVGTLAARTGATVALVSQHLAKLRLAGLVKGRREGTFVYYSAADNHVRGLLAQALHHAEHVDRDLPSGDHAHRPRPRPYGGPAPRS